MRSLKTVLYIITLFSSIVSASGERQEHSTTKETCSTIANESFNKGHSFSRKFTEELERPQLTDREFENIFGITKGEIDTYEFANLIREVSEVHAFLKGKNVPNNSRNLFYSYLARSLNIAAIKPGDKVSKQAQRESRPSLASTLKAKILRQKTPIIEKSSYEIFFSPSEEEREKFYILRRLILNSFQIVPNEYQLSNQFADFLAASLISKFDNLYNSKVNLAKIFKQHMHSETDLLLKNFLLDSGDEEVLEPLIRYILRASNDGSFNRSSPNRRKTITKRVYALLTNDPKNEKDAEVKKSYIETVQYVLLHTPKPDIRHTTLPFKEQIKLYQAKIIAGTDANASLAEFHAKLFFYSVLGFLPIDWSVSLVKKLLEGELKRRTAFLVNQIKEVKRETEEATTIEMIPHLYKNANDHSSQETSINLNKRKNQQSAIDDEGLDEELTQEDVQSLRKEKSHYKLEALSKKVEKQLRSIDKATQQTIKKESFKEIESNPSNSKVRKVVEGESKYGKTTFRYRTRIRSVDYRILFQVSGETISIIKIATKNSSTYQVR